MSSEAPSASSAKSSGANWNGSKLNRSGIGWSSSHSPVGAMRTTACGRRFDTAAISAAIMPPIEWPIEHGLVDPEGVDDVPAVKREIEHVLEEVLAGRLPVAG